MNLFQKYGIKEVADVVFYSINSIGDEIIYTPVLFLDTLKVSTIEKSAEKVSAEGGLGNKKLITWNFGKTFTLNLEDALFTPASMSLIWGGKLQSNFSDYTSAIVKINVANKYGLYHYSTKAYASPSLSEEEWKIVFKAATDAQVEVAGKVGGNDVWYISKQGVSEEDAAYVAENQVLLKKAYFQRKWNDIKHAAMPQAVIDTILTYIDELRKIGDIATRTYDVEVIDRMEKVIIKQKEGLTISTLEQKKNLLRYYADDRSSGYTIYYDTKTMLPLFYINKDGEIEGWNSTDDTLFTLKYGQVVSKWTRTVKYKDGDQNSTLGHVLVIDADTFPGDYKIVGETYIREQKTGKDQRLQFTINRAQVSTDTSITLQADGDPTTFNMSVDVLAPPSGDLIEFKTFDVDEDVLHGGTYIQPQKAKYTHTSTEVVDDDYNLDDIDNNEIY